MARVVFICKCKHWAALNTTASMVSRAYAALWQWLAATLIITTTQFDNSASQAAAAGECTGLFTLTSAMPDWLCGGR